MRTLHVVLLQFRPQHPSEDYKLVEQWNMISTVVRLAVVKWNARLVIRYHDNSDDEVCQSKNFEKLVGIV